MLEKEFKYYIENQNELVKKYLGKFVVIKDNEVIGYYNTQAEAYNESIKTHNIGTFLIQHCMPGTENYTQTFHSRVMFNKSV